MASQRQRLAFVVTLVLVFSTLNRKLLYNSGMHLFCITTLCYFLENHTTFTTNQMPVKLKPWLFYMMTSFTENPRQASFPPAKIVENPFSPLAWFCGQD